MEHREEQAIVSLLDKDQELKSATDAPQLVHIGDRRQRPVLRQRAGAAGVEQQGENG